MPRAYALAARLMLFHTHGCPKCYMMRLLPRGEVAEARGSCPRLEITFVLAQHYCRCTFDGL